MCGKGVGGWVGLGKERVNFFGRMVVRSFLIVLSNFDGSHFPFHCPGERIFVIRRR